MAKQKAPIKVFYWKTKHKGDDVWKVAVDKAGNGPLIEPKTRYTRPHSARVGGARAAGAYPTRVYSATTGRYRTVGWQGQDNRPVQFVNSKPPKK